MSLSFTVKLKNDVEKIEAPNQVSFQKCDDSTIKIHCSRFFFSIHVYGKCYKISNTSFSAKKA